MGIKKGTKLTDNPKSIMYQIRMTEEEDRVVKEIMKRDNLTKSEVIRKGIELQYNK